MAVNPDGVLTFRQLKQYRKLVFPACLAQEGHKPFFSLDKIDDWVTPSAIKCFRNALGEVGSDKIMGQADHQWETVPLDVLKAYRSFILPPKTVAHDFFKFDNADNWILDGAFGLFLQDYNSPGGCTAVDSKPPNPSDSINGTRSEGSKHIPVIKQEPSSVALGKRRAYTPEPIVISSDEEEIMKPHSAIVKKPKKRQKTKENTSNILDLTMLSDAEPDVKPYLTHSKSSGANLRRSEKSQVPLPPKRSRPIIARETAIKVTKKEFVQFVKHLEDIPTVWDVPRRPTAYILDLSNNARFSEAGSIIKWIRHEDQSSWEGSGGHANGDADVTDLFGEENLGTIRCRRADFRCNGIKTCEYIDRKLLDGFESWERDDSEMAPFWEAELEENEEEFSNPDGPLARFYRRTMESKCKVECNGKPVIRKLKQRSVDGKYTFIGCTGWRLGDNRQHRYLPIDRDLDEGAVADMLSNDGKLPTSSRGKIREDGKCSLILHPRSHKTQCSFTHVINGKVKHGKIQPYQPACTSRLLIFEPVDQTIRKAIVIAMHPHNHPRHPHAKPTLSEKEFVKAASKASGKTGIPPKALRTSATTSALLKGKSWESQVPGMVDSRRLRKFLNVIRKENYPSGLDWAGVQYEVDNRESKLPIEQRYIHTVTTKGNCRLVVTMHPRIVKHIHSARFLVLDYTFKRIHGDMNEWEVAGTIERYKTRVTYASLYCNKATREGFNLIFDEFFDVVQRITGKKLEFATFNPEAKLLVLLFDAEAAQMQACGDKLLRMNNPEISKITTKDPLEIVQHFAKTCIQHFYRNIDKLPNNIPREVINRLKSFTGLDTQEDIEAWHNFCKSSPYLEIINWYNQKIAHPWYLPSLNRFLSRVPKENWDSTPKDSNIGEGAHAGRNSETEIGRPLLAGILDARYRDNEIADRLDHFESNFTMGERFNLPYNREKRSASRREATHRKIQAVDSARIHYEALEKQIEELSQKRQISLTRKKEITERLSEITTELGECSKVSMLASNLKEERDILRTEEREGVVLRKEWSAKVTQLKEEMKAIKENELKNVRVHDPRQTPSSPPPPTNISLEEKENLPHPSSTAIPSPRRVAHESLISSPLKEVIYNEGQLDFDANEEEREFDFEPQLYLPSQPFLPSPAVASTSAAALMPVSPHDTDRSEILPSWDFNSKLTDDSVAAYYPDEDARAASLAIMEAFMNAFPDDVPVGYNLCTSL